MSKFARAAVIAVFVLAPAFGAAVTTSPSALGAGIGWDQAPASASAGAPAAQAMTVSPADGIGWD